MSANCLVFAWNRSLAGREHVSAQHFQDFVQYLTAEKQKGTIDSFDPVLLEPHGGTTNGFFLIKGDPAKLQALAASPEWVQHQVRGVLHLDGAGTWRGVTGAAVQERMGMWVSAIPR